MNTQHHDLLVDLPGEELIRPGLDDFCAKRKTIESLLVAIISNRLRKYGILHCEDKDLPIEAEHQLYFLLVAQSADPYSQYRAYTGRMAKFENALDHRVSRLAKM